MTQDGTLTNETRSDGDQYEVCYFEDNQKCEEWALLRGNCPVGGIKVISYVTDAGRCYAITGGALAITGNSGQGDEQGTCTLPNGVLCEVWDYWKGECDAYTVPTEAMAAGLTIQPLPIEVCDGQAQAMSHALDDLIPIQSEEPLYDPFTGASGTGYWRSPARYQAPERLGTSSRSFAGMVNSQPQAVDSSPIPHNSFHSEVKL